MGPGGDAGVLISFPGPAPLEQTRFIELPVTPGRAVAGDDAGARSVLQRGGGDAEHGRSFARAQQSHSHEIDSAPVKLTSRRC